MYEVIQDNMLAVMCCLCMIYFLLRNNSFESQIKKFFLYATILSLLLIITDACERLEAVKDYPTLTRITASVVGYTIRPAIAYFVCRASLKIKKIRFGFLLELPLLVNLLVVLSAFFSPIAFSYNSANEFIRGPLGFIPFITGLVYVAAICYISVGLISKGCRDEAGIVLFIMAILIAATIGESKFGLNAMLGGGCCVGLIFYYLYLNIHINEHDILTGAKVRRNFYLDADRNLKHLAAVISIDLNDLKALNDQYGHRAGDTALVTLSNTVKELLPSDWGFYRTGGDEFMILCYKTNQTEVEDFLQKFTYLFEKNGYTAATGFSMYQKGMDFEKVCHTSDEMMYEKKRHMKN